jgi:acetyl esterase/lipase
MMKKIYSYLMSACLFGMGWMGSVTDAHAQFGFGGQQMSPETMHYSQKFADLNYADDGQAYHTLDIYLPEKKAERYPVVIHVYGSAWFSNNGKGMADLATICKAYLDAGYAVVTPNHRSSGDAHYPAQLHDMKAVVRFVRAHAAEYHFDTSFIATSGFSSGGHLSSLTAATSGTKQTKVGTVDIDLEGKVGNNLKESSAVNAAVDWSGPIDLQNMNCEGHETGPNPPEQVLLGEPLEGHEDLYASLSPISYLNAGDPPTIIFHGTADNVVPCCQGKEFAKALREHGIVCQFYLVEGGGHGFNMYSEENLKRAVSFLNRARVQQGSAKLESYKFEGNPIIKNKFTADPAPMVSNGRLYLYVGHDEWYDGQDSASGGHEFNITEWLCYSTKDMKTWTDHGAVFRPEDFAWSVGEAWASQVVERNGKFYYYTSCQAGEPWTGKAIGVAVSDSPTGPFIDPLGKPLVNDKMTDNGARGWWNDIDPTVLIDDDGQAYLCWGNGTCFMAKLKDNMIELDGDIWTVDVPKYVEGPWLSKRKGIYYLTYASMGDDHKEAIDYATSSSIRGPWKHQGQVTGGAENSFTIHPGIATFKGKDYLFYHNAVLTIDGHKGAIGRRSVCVSPMKYDKEGKILFVNQK